MDTANMTSFRLNRMENTTIDVPCDEGASIKEKSMHETWRVAVKEKVRCVSSDDPRALPSDRGNDAKGTEPKRYIQWKLGNYVVFDAKVMKASVGPEVRN